MRFVALAGPDGRGGRVAWGSEADALEDVALSQFVLDFIIVPFCAFFVVGTPTIGWAKLVWYKLKQYKVAWPKLRQYHSFGTNLRRTLTWAPIVAPAPFGRRKWGHPLLAVPSSEPTQAYPPTWPSQIGRKNRWVGLLDIHQSKPSHLYPPPGGFKF